MSVNSPVAEQILSPSISTLSTNFPFVMAAVVHLIAAASEKSDPHLLTGGVNVLANSGCTVVMTLK